MQLVRTTAYSKLLMLLILIIILFVLSIATLTGCSKATTSLPNTSTSSSMITDEKSFAVPTGKTFTFYVRVEPKDSVEASFTIMGGEHDIDFFVQDPLGNLIVEKKRATATGAFAFVAAAKGYYQIIFDNTFSTQNNKLVWMKITHPSTGE